MGWAAACATDTVPWALNPPVVATACALPLPPAVTKPNADTVATPLLSEDQPTLACLIVSALWSSTTATTCRVAPSEVKLSELGATWRVVATGTNGSVPLQAARAMVRNVIGAQRRRVTGIGVTIPAPVHGATLGKCSRTTILDRGDFRHETRRGGAPHGGGLSGRPPALPTRHHGQRTPVLSPRRGSGRPGAARS